MLPEAPHALTRREAISRILAASALAASGRIPAFAEPAPSARGIGFDPNLLEKEIPWPRLLSKPEKAAVSALADLILPADAHGPAASALGVPDFIDEWVSAPYAEQQRDLRTIRAGLVWLDEAAGRRFFPAFADCHVSQQRAIVHDILRRPGEAWRRAYPFFVAFRRLAAGGYYSTTEGWAALGYVGNVPLPSFNGPPAAVLRRLGLDAR